MAAPVGSLKQKQKQAVEVLLSGNDVVAIRPTSAQSLVNTIVLVISPSKSFKGAIFTNSGTIIEKQKFRFYSVLVHRHIIFAVTSALFMVIA